VPLHKAGVLYINTSTGERSLTLYDDSTKSPNARLADPAEVGLRSGAVLFDYWMSTDSNPCDVTLEGWAGRADNFGINADSTNDGSHGITEPVALWDYGDMPFDSKITGVLISTAVLATESTDSNGDGTLDSGIDAVAVYYDGLSEAARSSSTPPTAAVRIESIPGNRGEVPNGFSAYDVIVDFGGDWFELGDSDGENLGALWFPGANPGRDVVVNRTDEPDGLWTAPADGLADFQYLRYYAQHGSDDKVTQDSTFIRLGTPEGQQVLTTYTTLDQVLITTDSGATTTITTIVTVTASTLVPDQLPQGQGVFESLGFGALGPGGDTTSIDQSPYGCCFWYGGLDCAGFLDQLIEEPVFNSTWYNLSPFAQLAHGFFSDAPPPDLCAAIDLNADGILDSGDIGAFIALFLAADPAADLNADGVTDNGDIAVFVNRFLSCTG